MMVNNAESCADKSDAIVSQRKESEPIVSAILRAVQKKESSEIDTIEPLYQSIEPEALEKLLSHARERHEPITISFTVDEYLITLTQDGSICVA